MIKRTLEKVVLKLAKGFPAIVIQGPRQSGKTTLSKICFPKKPYVSFENPDVELFAKDDPRSFLEQYKDGAIFDEVQRVPELFRYLQEVIDSSKKCGRFILTGSSQLLLNEKVSQSLAGRVGIVECLPFSMKELSSIRKFKSMSIEQLMYKGGYPPLYDRKLETQHWFQAYTAQYVEKDIRQLLNIQNHSLFHLFLLTCAAHTGQTIDTTKFSNQIGVDASTVKRWLSILETSYICYQLKPYFKNYNKRLVKKPKLYFHDTGLVCYLLKIQSYEDIISHPYKGAIFENWVINESLKFNMNKGYLANPYFWRDNKGTEIDLVLPVKNEVKFFEIKSGKTISTDWFKSLKKFSDHGKLNLIYSGNMTAKRSGIQIISYKDIENYF
jgi:uncharacterized protein